jgi:hypothetical protein
VRQSSVPGSHLNHFTFTVIDQSPWTSERIETLSRMWREGIRSGKIAPAMGITRAAVMGKLRRLGMVGTKRAAQRREARRAPVIRRRAHGSRQ